MFKEILIGLLTGLIYSFLFLKNLKKLYKNQSGLKKILIFFTLAHIFILTLFAFFIFRFRLNIIILSLSFLVSFWVFLLNYET